jgi:hypothetical protein
LVKKILLAAATAVSPEELRKLLANGGDGHEPR